MSQPETGSDAPKGGGMPHQVEAFDADEHAGNLTDWEQKYDQISAGTFHGTITELPLADGLQVFHEYTSQTLHQQCNIWPDSAWFGIAADKGAQGRINGMELAEHELMCRPGNSPFELLTPEKHHIYGIVAKHEELERMADVQQLALDWKELNGNERLSMPLKTMADLRVVLNRMLREPSVLPASRMQHDIIMMALLEILECQSPVTSRAPSYERRKRVVDQVREYIAENRHKPVTITELCDQVFVSRRTLQYSFESIIGMSPVQYLRLSRLNGVRRDLLCACADKGVTEVAAAWGFMHLGQFAKDYRELFGELPSQTLEKAVKLNPGL